MGLHRTVVRSLIAQSQDRIPGKPGRIPSTVKASKVSPTKLSILKKPSSFGHDKSNMLCANVYRKPAIKNSLALLEVCAYPGSALSHAFAKAGHSAVRIAYRKQACTTPTPGPEPVMRVCRESL